MNTRTLKVCVKAVAVSAWTCEKPYGYDFFEKMASGHNVLDPAIGFFVKLSILY